MKLELKEIKKQREEWLEAVNKNDILGVKNLLTEDAVWIPPGMPALKGKSEIADWINPFFETYNYKFKVEKTDVRGAGDWAVEHASFTSKLEPKDGGEGTEYHGKYLMIWRWEKDNKWRIERYLDTSDTQN